VQPPGARIAAKAGGHNQCSFGPWAHTRYFRHN
jgi:hypothetical protein